MSLKQLKSFISEYDSLNAENAEAEVIIDANTRTIEIHENGQLMSVTRIKEAS